MAKIIVVAWVVVALASVVGLAYASAPRSPRPKTTYKSDCIFVLDAIDPLDGTILRHVYCIHPEGGKVVRKGHCCSYVDNIKIREEGGICRIIYGEMEITTPSPRYLYLRAEKTEVDPFLDQFPWSSTTWFGYAR